MSEKIGNTTLREKVSKEVTAVMMARAPDLPLPKAQAKVASALGWWIGAGVCVFVGFAFAAGGIDILRSEAASVPFQHLTQHRAGPVSSGFQRLGSDCRPSGHRFQTSDIPTRA